MSADDVGLRDRLLLADRQRMVAVGAVAQRLLDEEMARHPPHDGEHARIGDARGARAAPRPCRLAGPLVRVARPLH